MLSVIVDEMRDPAWNLALDEALVRVGTPLPMLRIWQNAPSVVVGRFQDVARCADLASCARDGVRVVRRASGGGAVFTDSGTLNVTLVRAAPGRRCAEPWRPRSGARPDLDVLVATAVEGFGLPAAALRDGIMQVGRIRTARATLTHVAVHVTPLQGQTYIAPAGAPAAQRTLAEAGLEASMDAVRAAVLCGVVDEYGIAATRRPSERERAHRDHLYAVRYGDVTWHLAGSRSQRRGTRDRSDLRGVRG
ncbi:hypothetical protein [Spirillospora sp. NPDC047279]|uniref:lipoate--protein ligase family protein n=1 Tax=Spirillospora sp. NPDC047279 TaxID=3155478 RepID=UPI0033E06B51